MNQEPCGHAIVKIDITNVLYSAVCTCQTDPAFALNLPGAQNYVMKTRVPDDQAVAAHGPTAAAAAAGTADNAADVPQQPGGRVASDKSAGKAPSVQAARRPTRTMSIFTGNTCTELAVEMVAC